MTEPRIAGLRRLFRLPRSRRSIRAEIEDEIRFHLDARTEELCRRGVQPAVARDIAAREYGDLEASRAELTEMEMRRHAKSRMRELAMSILQDLRYSARGLVLRPALTVVTTFTLTLGIGANAVVFNVVDQLLLRPPAHVPNARQLRQIYVLQRGDEDEAGGTFYQETTSYAVIRALRDLPAFSDVVATYRRSFVLGRGAGAELIDVSLVDGSLFTTLGTAPAAGRFFTPNVFNRPLDTREAVVSARFRDRHFGQSSDPIGQTLTIEGIAVTVTGVAPPEFSGVDREANTDVWVPVATLAQLRLGPDWQTDAGLDRFHAIASLRDGVSEVVAASQTTAALRGVARAAANPEIDTLATAVLGSINNLIAPDGISAEAKTSVWLMGVSAIVLLVAAANVANLLFARAVQRRREIAVRLALGVSRLRLVRQLLIDALLPALIAGAGALIGSTWAARLVERLLLPGFVWSQSWMNWRVLAFTLVVMMIACLLAGLTPAVTALRTDVNHALKAGARLWTGSRSRLRNGLLIAQAALSVVLLVGAGLFVRSLARVNAADVGIDLDRVAIVAMDLDRAGYDTTRQRVAYAAMLDRLRHLPGIAAVTAVGASTPTRIGLSIEAAIPGVTEKRTPKTGGPYYSVVDEGFLATLGTRVLRGRPFLADELRAPSRVALVNRTMAEFYWPGEDPIGKCLMLGRDRACTTIVGVVQPVMVFRVVNEAPYAQLLIPATHPVAGSSPRTVFVRASTDAPTPTAVVREALQDVAPDVPYIGVRTLADVVAPQLQPWRLGATMFTAFGLIALAIAAIGLYSVMAYWVSQRTYEFGVRMALGAQRRDIQRAVLREAMRTIGVGLGIGIVLALVAAPRIADLLYETSAHDVRVYAIAIGALGLAALAATIVPTWRSTRVNLVMALRAD